MLSKSPSLPLLGDFVYVNYITRKRHFWSIYFLEDLGKNKNLKSSDRGQIIVRDFKNRAVYLKSKKKTLKITHKKCIILIDIGI